jgi:predicted DCC family thiol-disulfide oxidoreductase YuxK
MPDDFPLTVFYDAGCPVCALEMDALRQRDRCDRLKLVDMSAPGFDARSYGLDHDDLDAVIHALRPDGTVLRGMEVLRSAYGAAGLGWLLGSTRWPVLKPAFDAAYRVFARHRHAISRLLGPLIHAARARSSRRGGTP